MTERKIKPQNPLCPVQDINAENFTEIDNIAPTYIHTAFDAYCVPKLDVNRID